LLLSIIASAETSDLSHNGSREYNIAIRGSGVGLFSGVGRGCLSQYIGGSEYKVKITRQPARPTAILRLRHGAKFVAFGL
jgi:hypothetical protein